MLAVAAAVALDLGTTTIKAGLLSADGELHGIVARPVPEMNVDGGRYESDALAYAHAADEVLAECLARIAGLAQTDARPPLGLCCQRSSFLVWERATGRPVTPLISWQDDRGAASCEALRGEEAEIRALAGLPITSYYLAPKLRVLLREHPAWREHLVRGEWLLGTLDTFLIWRWTDGRHYQTDASMAARTLLMDVHERQWSPRLCELFGVPREALPEMCDSAGWALPLNNGLTLMASVADQSAALVASIAIGSSDALVNLGTGGFVIRHLPYGCAAPAGYLQTLLWQDGDGLAHFACEGTLNSIASALAPYPAADCRAEELARDDIFCLAEPSGLGAPYFRKDLGLMFSAPVEGLPPQRIAALLLEGIVFRVARMLEDMHSEFGIERVYLSGGLSNLSCLQQGIARCAPFADVYLSPQSEVGLVGAARLAAGMPLVVERGVEKIAIICAPSKLAEKYACWKVWLDGLLSRRAAL
ncbi:MAG: FGGY family carbohydrate kinase [Gallionella sp.]|nr:FGGY family carbohydrate kinase [Gallionella sp.]MCK9355474.1 FGGY family carbohydrate kinase [Gallionella sp.]